MVTKQCKVVTPTMYYAGPEPTTTLTAHTSAVLDRMIRPWHGQIERHIHLTHSPYIEGLTCGGHIALLDRWIAVGPTYDMIHLTRGDDGRFVVTAATVTPGAKSRGYCDDRINLVELTWQIEVAVALAGIQAAHDSLTYASNEQDAVEAYRQLREHRDFLQRDLGYGAGDNMGHPHATIVQKYYGPTWDAE